MLACCCAGAVAIDNELVEQKLKEAEQVVTMDNGCMCCTVRGDISDAVKGIITANEAKPEDKVRLSQHTRLPLPLPNTGCSRAG